MAFYSFPIVTALTAAVLGIIFVVLTMYVIAGRVSLKVMIGDGASEDLNRRIRIHGNFAENAPMFLILLALVELSGEHAVTVAILGPLFVVCRISHAIGMFGNAPNPFRALGAIGTIVIHAVLAIELLVALLPHLGQW